MEKYLKTLLNVIKHFQTNASPSAKHNERFRLAIGLFPQGGCGPGDKLSTQSKRRGACTFLTKVHKDLGFDVFLLCTFAFAPTTLYDIGQLGSFNDESQKKIKELLQDVSGHFGTVVEEFKKKSEVVFVEDVYHALHGQAPGRSKRKLTSTEEASERATAHRIRRLTPKDGESSDVGTTRPSIGPPVSNAPLKGKVYKISVEDTFRLLALTKKADLQQQITVPDSEQWPFITFRCNPREVIQYLTESDHIMSLA